MNQTPPRVPEPDEADLALLGELRRMWEAADPPPPQLVDRMIAAVAAEDVDLEYELLGLVERSLELQGTRGTVADPGAAVARLEFSNDTVTVILMVGPSRHGHRRVDGWVVPIVPMSVRLANESGAEQVADEVLGGRFSFVDVGPGLVRLWLTPEASEDAAAAGFGRPFATPLFEIQE